MDSGVEFVAVDMPEVNRLTLHILAAVAEHEREMISQRTKAALAQAKVRGRPSHNRLCWVIPPLDRAGTSARGIMALCNAVDSLRPIHWTDLATTDSVG